MEFDATNRVIVFEHSKVDIGYIARTITRGKELNMVKSFVECLKKSASKCSKKHTAIFFEPQLDTGYPDLVIVEYYSLPKIRW